MENKSTLSGRIGNWKTVNLEELDCKHDETFKPNS